MSFNKIINNRLRNCFTYNLGAIKSNRTIAYKKDGGIPSADSDCCALYVTKNQLIYHISNESLLVKN